MGNPLPRAVVLFVARLAAIAGFAIAAVVVSTSNADAVPANPAPLDLEQPNGKTFGARQWGDEWSHGYETLGGYTVIKKKGVWYYAKEEDGRLSSTGERPDERARPSNAARHARPSTDRPEGAPATMSEIAPAPPGGGHTGNTKLLGILVDFNDRAPVSTNASYWNGRFFGAQNSVKSFYQAASFGNLNIEPASESHGTANDGVVGFVRLNRNHPNPQLSGPVQVIARDAIVAADPFVNYAAFDTNGNGILSTRELHIIVILAGYETSYGGNTNACAPSVWGHNWSIQGNQGATAPVVDGKTVGGITGDGGYSMFGEHHCSTGDTPGHSATVGIMAHEFGHDIRMPDLYDTDQGSAGVGQWSTMGGGSWTTVPGQFQGSFPSGLDAFMKSYHGWITPTRLQGSNANVQVGTASTNPQAIQLLENPNGVDWSFNSASGTGEYFLVENRQQTGLDVGLPACGLLVWHVDETRTSSNSANATDSRRLLDVEEADGLNHLDTNTNRGDAGDLYGSSGRLDFNSTTNPNSNLYSGATSGVSMHADSTSCAPTMQADFTAPGGGGGGTSSLSVNTPAGVTEGGTINFTVSANPVSSSPITFTATTSNGSAAAPGDYTSVNNTFTIPANAASANVPVATVQDANDEANETFLLTISNPSGGHTIGTAQGTGTILDDDNPTACTDDNLEQNDSQAAATSIVSGQMRTATICANDDDWFKVNASVGQTIGITLAGGAGGDLDLSLHESGGALLTSSTGSTANESISHTVTASGEPFGIRVYGYQGAENTYSITVEVTGGTAPSQLSIDTPPGVTEGGQINFTVTAAPPNASQITFTAATSNGSATAGDYTTVNQQFTIAANASSATVSVSTAQDAEDEGDETFVVTISAPSSNAQIATAQGTGTIIDDDSPATCTDDAMEENDTRNAATALASGQTRNGKVCPNDDDFFSTSALAGQVLTYDLDFSHAVGDVDMVLQDPAGTNLVISESADDDERIVYTVPTGGGGDHFLRVYGYQGATNGYALTLGVTGGTTTSSLSINTPVGVNEGGQVIFTVTASPPNSQAVTFSATTSNGTADASDFTAIDQQFTIPANAASTNVSVSTTDDTADEPDETFVVTISKPSTNATIGTAQGTGTIVDDDVPAGCQDDNLEDNDSIASATSLNSSETRNGQACPNDNDFFATSVNTGQTASFELVFTHANGDLDMAVHDGSGNSLAVSQSVDDDEEIVFVPQASGTYYLRVYGYQGAQNAYVVSASVAGGGQTTQISVANASAVDEGGQLGFVVTASPPSTSQITFSAKTSNGSATSGDYTPVDNQVAIPANASSVTVPVQTIDDVIDENDETVQLNISNPSGSTTIGTASATGTIRDNDAGGGEDVTVSIVDPISAVLEGGKRSANLLYFTVELSGPASIPVSFEACTVDGTARSGYDFFGGCLLEPVTFNPGETEKTVYVQVIGDKKKERQPTFPKKEEYLFVEIFDVIGAPVDDDTATGIIIDDDR